jgi:LEA14-like dessication related protein
MEAAQRLLKNPGMHRSLYVSAVTVASAIALSGCSLFMHSIEKPKAEVRNVNVTSAGFTGVTGELRLDVMNPNSFGVPLAGIDWQLSLGGARAVTGSVQLSQTIPAKGVAPVTTSLTISAIDAAMVAGRLASGSRDYQIHATLKFSTSVGQVDVVIDHKGQLGEGGSSTTGGFRLGSL